MYVPCLTKICCLQKLHSRWDLRLWDSNVCGLLKCSSILTESLPCQWTYREMKCYSCQAVQSILMGVEEEQKGREQEEGEEREKQEEKEKRLKGRRGSRKR